ncbi:helix-turn-helix domain-containing protein [Pelomonas sp. SE-A7]|uniref:GlxA family transcriptional regulator n=1 Tax=Pelomonas sp. SE-A7 TaxID=3054953 RepID=UPI00259C7302|nr:helix-turn-helix domain-containing protein [Pelomonas sp. SE-A7]MDM4765688.1 helix-turn-helix domain-containing protein [Pelomonas sp. SE-A7]
MTARQSQPRCCGVLLTAEASLLAAAAVQAALLGLNELQDEAAYEAPLLAEAGGLLRLAGGAAVQTQALAEAGELFALFVVAGEGQVLSEPLRQALQERRELVLAGVDGGALLLAAAGLLDGQRATVDWRLQDLAQQEHGAVVWSGQVWEMAQEGRRLSSAAGVAVLDLMLAWAARLHGERVSQQLALQLSLAQPRAAGERQRPPITELMGGGSARLSEALALMEANLGEPLPTEDIARLVGLSRRQLERLFKQHLDSLPSRYYLELRLRRAQRLLQQSSQSILQIGLSCGFASGPHFSNAYKSFFGRTPREERGQRAAAWRQGAPGEST